MGLSRSAKRAWRRFRDTGEASLDGVRLLTDVRIVGEEARDLILEDAYERPERDLLRSALSKDDRVLEFGGCLGLLSLFCARIVGERNVLCYEPNPIACEIIRKNYALNGLSPELREKALTVDGGDVQFFRADNLFSSSLYERDKAGSYISVPSDRFADVVRDWRPTILVVDIEGAECEVLPSADLSAVKKIILETHAKIVGDEPTDRLLQQLSSAGFQTQSQKHKRVFLSR